MELLLSSEIDRPVDSGLIIGTRVQSGKYLITHFVPITTTDAETIIGYCEQIVTRLIGGVDIVGCYNHTEQLICALKEFTQQFVAVTFDEEGKTVAKMYASNKVSRSEVKLVPRGKYPVTVVKSNVNLTCSIASDTLEYNHIHGELQHTVELLVERLLVTVDGGIGSKGDLIFPKTTKSYPETMSVDCYFNGAALDWSQGANLTVVNIRCSMSLFALICPKSTHGELVERLQDDMRRSMVCRLAIVEEAVVDAVRDDEKTVETLYSSSQLPKRVNYVLNDVPVSLYESKQQPASADLADFFGISESNRLFDYVEEEIDEDDDVDVDAAKARTYMPIIAVLVLIISLVIAILLQP